MKKILLLIFFSAGLFFLFPKEATAVSQTGSCTWTIEDSNKNTVPPFTAVGSSQIPITVTVSNLDSNSQYKIYVNSASLISSQAPLGREITKSLTISRLLINRNTILNVDQVGSVVNPVCSYTISPNDWKTYLSPTPAVRADCNLTISPSNVTNTSTVTLNGTINNVVGMTSYGAACHGTSMGSILCRGSVEGLPNPKSILASDFSTSGNTFKVNLGSNYPGEINNVRKYTASVTIGVLSTTYPIKFAKATCSISFQVPGGEITPFPTTSLKPLEPFPSLAPLCDQLPGEFRVDCKNCVESQHKIWTAIGCVSPDLGTFISDHLLVVGVGLAGAVAFLYFLYGAFLFLTSQGNPEQIAMGREIIMSSILGLMLIIFSVFLLRIIAIDILDLKGFGFSK